MKIGRNHRKIYWVFAPENYGWHDGILIHNDEDTRRYRSWSNAKTCKNVKQLKRLLRRYSDLGFHVKYLTETKEGRSLVCWFENLSATKEPTK